MKPGHTAFADGLSGINVVFHTAAYFRDNYKGGKHWDQLYNTNGVGTARLLERGYEAGVRRFGHSSWPEKLAGINSITEKVNAKLGIRITTRLENQPGVLDLRRRRGLSQIVNRENRLLDVYAYAIQGLLRNTRCQ